MKLSPVWKINRMVVHPQRKPEKVSKNARKQAETRRKIEQHRDAIESKHELDALDFNY